MSNEYGHFNTCNITDRAWIYAASGHNMQGAQLSFQVPFSKTQLWLTFTLLRVYFS